MKKAIRKALRKSEVNVEAFKTYAIILMASYILGKAIIIFPLGAVAKGILIVIGIILSALDLEYELTAFSAFLIGFVLAA